MHCADIVFCIDCTESMGLHINSVKEMIYRILSDVKIAYEMRSKNLHELRVRIVAFRDLANDLNSLEVSEFFIIEPSSDREDVKSFLNQLKPSSRGNERKSALEALAIAFSSEWTDKGDRQRHIVVVFTDASAHKLEDRVGNVPAEFADSIPKSLDELNEMWDGDKQEKLKKSARRLIVFGPDSYPWNTIGDYWGNTAWLPSQAGVGLAEEGYRTILDMLVHGI